MKLFLLKDLCEDCVDVVVRPINDNIKAEEIQHSIDETKERCGGD